jgi:hypothetical protein
MSSNLMTVAASLTPPNMGERKNRWPANVRVTIKWTHPEAEPNHPDTRSGMRFTPCVSSPMGLNRSICIGAAVGLDSCPLRISLKASADEVFVATAQWIMA